MAAKKSALNLRLKGYTYPEIEAKLGIPRSTLSIWFRELTLPDSTIKILSDKAKKRNHLTRKKAVEANKRKYTRIHKDLKDQAMDSARKDISKIKNKDLKLALAMLYLGEGGKNRGHILFGNSDPTVIKLFLHSLKKLYKVKPESLKCRISHRYDQNISELNRYWSEVTKIPLKNFYKSTPDPRTKGKPTSKKDYKGVCVIYWTSGEARKALLELEATVKIFRESVGL